MGLLFRKRLRLGKFLSLNVSKSGLGLSVGPPGAKLSVNPKRARMQLGIPGTGLGYRRDVSMPKEGGEPSTPTRHHTGAWLLIGLLALLLLVYLLSACTSFPAWRDQTLREVAEGRWHVDPAQVPPSGAGPSQTTEFYDASGRHVGYGVMSDGIMNLYGLDGSRLGSGRRK